MADSKHPNPRQKLGRPDTKSRGEQRTPAPAPLPTEPASRPRDRAALGNRLRRLRMLMHKTIKQIEAALPAGQKLSQATISKIEMGDLRPKLDYVRPFGEIIGLSRAERVALEKLTELFNEDMDELKSRRKSDLPAFENYLANFFEITREFKIFNLVAIPSLLQTPQYAAALLQLATGQDKQQLREHIELAGRRSQWLDHPEKEFSFVLSESALLFNVCDKETMLGQLDQLEALALKKNVQFRILPFDNRLPVVPYTSFYLFDDKVVLVLTKQTFLRIWSEEDIQEYARDFNDLEKTCTASLPETLKLLDEVRQRITRRLK